ncbi:hypothetical protein C2G38_2029250 [Gigaspora rosea]|uniref:Uncharacterized protein n=1 Tax=Gigaspora rosea TaxID=44941 RepID=A0A397W8B4_9GLOM|nr:hypothetical protein C2G38_2029250 [Gigaspora rosea]
MDRQSEPVNHDDTSLRRQPPDPFRNCELKIASGTKNTFDLMRPKNARITDNNDAPNVSVGSSNATTKKKSVDPQFTALLGSGLKKFILIIFDIVCVILKWWMERPVI